MRIQRFATLLLAAVAALAVAAQTPQQMLDRAIAALGGTAVSANYRLSGSQGTTSGSIVMSGNKFRLTSSDVKCWYDGSTMWSYSSAIGEVNVTTPTSSDLQTTCPMAAAQGFKRNFNMWKAKGQIPGNYAILLEPKKKNDIYKVYLYISTSSNLLTQAHFVMSDGSKFTIKLTGYKTGVATSAATFRFDKSMVPAGTPVVDVR